MEHTREEAALLISERDARVVIDLSADPAAWLAWWNTGASVIAVTPLPVGYQPQGITALAGDPRDHSTQLRVVDQLAGRDADVVVVDGDRVEDVAYLMLMATGGLLLAYVDGSYAVIDIERH